MIQSNCTLSPQVLHYYLTLKRFLGLTDRYLCIASGRYVGIYSVDSGQRIHSLKRHAHHVVGLGIKDDNTLYSCDSSGKIIEWNVQSAEMLNVRQFKCS